MALPLLQFSESTRESLFDTILDSLETLPDLPREVFVRSHYRSQSVADIAVELGLPEETVTRLLADANEIFYRNLHRFRYR